MQQYEQYDWIFEQIVADAKKHDILTSVANHYGNGGGVGGIEGQLAVSYVKDSITIILESLSKEKLNDVVVTLLPLEEGSAVEVSLEDISDKLEGFFASWMDDHYDLYGNETDNEEEVYEEGWSLNNNDREAISFALEAAYSLLKKPNISPYQNQGLARAIYAMQQLPRFEQYIDVSFGLTKIASDSGFDESYRIGFTINEDQFSITETQSAFTEMKDTVKKTSTIYLTGPLFVSEDNNLGYIRDKFVSCLRVADVWVEDNSDPEVILGED